MLTLIVSRTYRLFSQQNSTLEEDWLGGEKEPLTGFTWRGGVERNTTGILMWSKAYPVELPSGEKVYFSA